MKRGLFLAGGAAATSLFSAKPALAVFGDERLTGTLTLGVAGPLTGAQIRAGEHIADGVRAALDEANHLSGPLDRTFAMRTFNDENLLPKRCKTRNSQSMISPSSR